MRASITNDYKAIWFQFYRRKDRGIICRHIVFFCIDRSWGCFAWGSNIFGELGTGNKNEALLPAKVIIPEPVTQIAAGPRGLALARSGTLYAWGTNQYGEVGDGTNEERLLPVKVEIPEKVVKIFRSSTGIALTENGALYTWGWNMQGEVGNGATDHVNTPYNVPLPRKVIEAAGFGTHTLALCEDGSLYAWGSNYFGELGDGKPVVNNGSIKDTELIENNMSRPREYK